MNHMAITPGIQTASEKGRQFLWRLLVRRGIQRNRRAGRNSADENPGVIASPSQLGYRGATDLKSANAINRDRSASWQLLDPTRQGRMGVHGGTRQHIGASREVLGQTEIQKYRSAIVVILERRLELLGRNPRFLLRRRTERKEE